MADTDTSRYTANRSRQEAGDKISAAVSRLSWDDVRNLPKMPCARNSLLTGMATGAGVIGINFVAGRGMRRALNWGVGSFIFVSAMTWEICRSQRRAERIRMQHIIERFPNRAAAAEADRRKGPAAAASAPTAAAAEPPVSKIAPSITS